MPDSPDLAKWIDKLKTASGRGQLLSMVEQFRVLEWTDNDRAAIAKLYIRLLESLPEDKVPAPAKETAAVSATAGEAVEDEEVWYEKM